MLYFVWLVECTIWVLLQHSHECNLPFLKAADISRYQRTPAFLSWSFCSGSGRSFILFLWNLPAFRSVSMESTGLSFSFCGLHLPFALFLWNPPAFRSVSMESTGSSLCFYDIHQSFALFQCFILLAEHGGRSLGFSCGMVFVAFWLAEVARVTGISPGVFNWSVSCLANNICHNIRTSLFFLCYTFCLEFSASWNKTHTVNHCI